MRTFFSVFSATFSYVVRVTRNGCFASSRKRLIRSTVSVKSAVPARFVSDATAFGSMNVPPGATVTETGVGLSAGKTELTHTKSNGIRAR